MTDAKPDDETPTPSPDARAAPGTETDADADADAVELATTEVENEPEARATAPPGSSTSPGRGRTSPLPLLALSVALLAVAATGFLWWQYRQFYVALADADAAADDALVDVRATQRSTSDRIGDLDATLRRYDQSLRELDDRLEAVPGQLADVRRRIDALQGGTFDARRDWLVAEAEYYLALANAELTLAANWETARAALRLADERLRELADPAFASIRDLVADEIIALDSVRLADTEGLSFSLGRLAERAEQLPLRTQAPARFASEATPDASEPGLGRLWQSVKDAFSSLVSIERRAGDVEMALSAEEARLVRRQLAVELQIARLALLGRQDEPYRLSLAAARALLEHDFKADEAEVGGAIALIDELLQLEIAPTPPDISRSLSALRARSGNP